MILVLLNLIYVLFTKLLLLIKLFTKTIILKRELLLWVIISTGRPSVKVCQFFIYQQPDVWQWHFTVFLYILAADHLVAVELLGQHSHRRLNDAASQTQHKMEGGLWGRTEMINSGSSLAHKWSFSQVRVLPTLLDVIVGQGASVLELLSSKDETLLIRWNTLKQNSHNCELVQSAENHLQLPFKLHPCSWWSVTHTCFTLMWVMSTSS